MVLCFVCGKNFHLDDLKSHIIETHFEYEQDKCTNYKCGETGCFRIFSDFRALKKHLQSVQHSCPDEIKFVKNEIINNVELKDHENLSQIKTKVSKSVVCSPIRDINTKDILVNENRSSPQIEFKTSIESDLTNAIDNIIIKKSVFLHSESNLSRKHVQCFFDSMKDVLVSSIELIEKNVPPTVEPNSCITNRISNIFQESFKKFDTEYKRLNYLETKGYYLPPTKFQIDDSYASLKRDISGNVKQNTENTVAYGYLFPLRSMLQKVFEIPGVYNDVINYKLKLERETNIITNIIQSKSWKRKLRNQKEKNLLPLILFNDDYEVGNGLGTHAGENKLSGTYITIGCFPPEYQSSLNSIFQALLFYSKDRQRFGNFSVFRLLITELKFLEKRGVTINLPQGKFTLFFKLAAIVGDNLGLHGLFGLVESFNANFACRFCKMDRIQRSLATVEDTTYLRTKLSYEKDLKLYDVSRTGIQDACVFHSIDDFHITDNWTMDVMHDLLEGVCKNDMVDIIKYLSFEKQFFSLLELKNLMAKHDWGSYEASNKPPKIKEKDIRKNELKMSASEVFTFVSHFGVLVGELVPENDLAWNIYLLLRQILALMTARFVQAETIAQLKVLVQSHNYQCRLVFKRHSKPKEHLLLHAPHSMAEIGPLSNLWCMRFESKHKENKTAAIVSNSKTNVCETIAVKSQLKLSNLIYNRYLIPPPSNGPNTKEYYVRELPVEFSKIYLNNDILMKSKVNIVHWAQKNGTVYKVNAVLIVDVKDDSITFGSIKFVCLRNSELLFVYNKLSTAFNDHEYAYEVVSENQISEIISYNDLLHFKPLSLLKNNDKLYIVLRSYV